MSSDIESTLNKARTLSSEGNHEQSRMVLLELLKSDPDHEAALMMLGGSYFVTGKLSEAEMVFERLVLLEPGTGQISIALFNTLWKLERHEEALEEIRRFMRHADRDVERETFNQYADITRAIETGKI